MSQLNNAQLQSKNKRILVAHLNHKSEETFQRANFIATTTCEDNAVVEFSCCYQRHSSFVNIVIFRTDRNHSYWHFGAFLDLTHSINRSQHLPAPWIWCQILWKPTNIYFLDWDIVFRSLKNVLFWYYGTRLTLLL